MLGRKESELAGVAVAGGPSAFGALLQQYRQATGLSQEELAELSGLSRRGISDLERGLRRAPYLATTRRLAEALRLTDQQRSELVAASRATSARTAPHRALPAVSVPPPDLGIPRQLTSFIGRDADLLELRRLLTSSPLLTLTGAGGVGKTRIALRLAELARPSWPDGTWWVELSVLSDPALVPRAVATSLGIAEQPGHELLETLARQLGPKRALLVLDNCEQVLGACADLVYRLLRRCPGLHIVTTTREPLRVPGETVWRVLPLPLPAEHDAFDQVADSDAVRLFLERAQASAPWFAVTHSTLQRVAAICRGLDGLPLAIELAAARLKLFGIDELAARLGDQLRLLVGGSRTLPVRQQTLRATLDWSYQLLSAAERLLFDRLSVFAGGWTLEAAERVCLGGSIESGDLVDLLERLVDTCLVQPEPDQDGQMRYRLLATVQQYSREQLQARGQEELEQVRHRHVEFFAEFAERAEAELVGPRQALWYACLEREHDNLRAALRWVIDCSELELGLRLGAALVRFWFIRGYFGEGSAWLNRLADLAHSGSSVSAAALAKILNGAGNFATLRGDFAGAKALLAESLRVRRELGDTAGVARTLLNLGNVAVSQRDFGAAEALFQESLALQRELGDDRGVARTLNNLSVVAREQEQTQRMLEYAEAAASLSRQVGDHEATALALVTLGIAARQRADLVASSALVKQSLRLFADLGHRRGIAECMELLAGLAYASGRPEQAARLFGAAETLAETVGLVPLAGDRFDYDQNVGAVRAELPEAVLALRWDEGRAMSLESALQAALNA